MLQVRAGEEGIMVLYNQEDITIDLGSKSLIDSDMAITLVDPSTVTTVFSAFYSTLAISITLDPTTQYLSYALNLVQPVTTSGILGNFNGNISDDFTFPDGRVLPSDASDQMIHEWGQACMFVI